MREIRIFQPGNYQLGDHLELTPEAGQHVGVVLRMQPKDSLILFCGDNREFTAVIERVKKKQVSVSIGSAREVNRESPLRINLGQAISKGERMELVVQKAVELGVTAIYPLISERCSVKLDKERIEKKVHQWQAIAIAACEQSGRNTVPVIHTPVYLDRFVQEIKSGLKLVLNPKAAKPWREYDLKQTEITLLIGPEGGLSDEEIILVKDKGFKSLSLGPRILRTETAAMAALTLLQAVGGDL